MAATDFIGLFSSVLGAAGAASSSASVIAGGQLASQGSLLSARGFRLTANSIKKATKFNQQLDAINTQRQIAAQGRQLQRTVGSQLAGAAGSGLAIGSKSFLMLRNEATDVFSRAIINLRTDATNAQRAGQFESTSRQTALENQARAAEFTSQVTQLTSATRASDIQKSAAIDTFGRVLKSTKGKGK